MTVTKAEMYVPNADGSYNMLHDQYSYDSLNRLQSVNELQWGTQTVFTQAYTYDRWGNRQINQAASSTNVNRQQFSINTANNRLGVPTGQSGQMTYDTSGNLTKDTYSRADTIRTYDGENRLVTNTDTSNQISRYTYDAAGKRVRRNINNQETWQVYGIGGELIAEYAANASPSTVQKEYGYRGGELLVTATSTAEVNWLIGDHLGTPRMIAGKTGTLSGVKRHDYLPFGEEIYAGMGGRTAQQGYSSDNVRQKFTKYERDNETGLDFAEARYFSSTQGRFTSTDPFSGSMRAGDPQSFNRYSYVGNNPVNRIDPSGMAWQNDAEKAAGSNYFFHQFGSGWGMLNSSAKGGRGDFDGFYDPEYSEAEEQVEEEVTDTVVGGTETTAAAPGGGTILIIVGDRGLKRYNQGDNFDRAAETKKQELEAEGYKVIVVRASGFADFANALTNNGMLDGVEYIGHSDSRKLFVGERHTAGTNVDRRNVRELSNANLTPNAYIKLNSCNAGKGGTTSIASWISNQLNRTTFAFDGDTIFSTSESRRTLNKTVPGRGPLYLIEDAGTRFVSFPH